MFFSGAVEEAKVELKYCELCGGLWYRPASADRVYCNSCHTRIKNHTVGLRRKSVVEMALTGGEVCV